MLWERLLADNGIEAITSGPNTKRGEVSIRCPFCGDSDPSFHLGISLTKEAWACWRDAQHRGKSPYRLVQALLGGSMAQARLTVAQYKQNDPEGLDEALAMLNAMVEAAKPDEGPTFVEWPPEFRNFCDDRFAKYLESRGFNAPKVAYEFGLKCADTGRYKDRIIFPLYLNGLIGWTGRAITNPVHAPRYLASSEKAKTTVYGYDTANVGGKVLFIVEGPFDALRINNDYGDKKVHAVAIMGTSLTISQMIILRAMKKKYEKAIVFLDEEAEAQAMQLGDMLGLNHVRGWGGKDAAEIDKIELDEIVNSSMKDARLTT